MNEVAGFVGMFGLLVLILLGINVMVALGTVGFLGIVYLVGFGPASTVLSNVTFSIVSSFHFSVVPMFLLMGFFAMQAGIGRDLFDAATKWLGRTPGGLALAATASASAFGAASGSSVGTATLFTKLALPEMIQRGYDKGLASGSIAIAGTLAVLIPPSALVVIYGILTNSSIAGLLVAGFLPGLLFAVLLGITIIILSLLNPSLAPKYHQSVSWGDRLRSLRLVGPLFVVMASVIGGLYAGVFTPTEAGGIGALMTLILAVIRKRGIRGVELKKALVETVTLSAMIFAIIICALIFSRFLALSGATAVLGDLISAEGLPVWLVVLMVTLVYLLLGTLMDPPALLAVSLPITHPVMMQLGFDPIWFGIYVVVLAEIGAVTPPVGLNCYVVKGAAGSLVELNDIFRGLWPFILTSFVMLGILLMFPEVVMFLPETMRG